MRSKRSLQVRLVDGRVREDAECLARFFRRTWDPNATAIGVSNAWHGQVARNTVAPGSPFPTIVAEADGDVVGYCSTLPLPLWRGGRQRAAYWIKGLMVLPDYRNGPVGHLLLKGLLRESPIAASLAVAPPARRLLEALGFRSIGILPSLIRPINAGRIATAVDPALLTAAAGRHGALALKTLQTLRLARAAGSLGQIAFDGALALRRSRPPSTLRSVIVPAAQAARALDALWAPLAAAGVAGPVRDSLTATQRYGGPNYTHILIADESTTRAWCVVRRAGQSDDPRFQGLRIATLSDLCCAPEDGAAIAAAADAAVRAAADSGADAILSTPAFASLPHWLRSRGWIGAGSSVHLLVRDPEVSPEPEGIGAWWLHRGDGEADT